MTTIDATCPFVARVHRQVRDYAARGMPVAVIGHSKHVEVCGVMDEARDAGAQVLGIASIFTYGMEKGLKRLSQARKTFPPWHFAQELGLAW